jgi:hypothetical protein
MITIAAGDQLENAPFIEFADGPPKGVITRHGKNKACVSVRLPHSTRPIAKARWRCIRSSRQRSCETER